MAGDTSLQTFISYSRINQQFAIRLACELKSAGFSVWMDQFDIPTGSRWDEEIEKALHECQIFLFIMTPDSVSSENAKDEVGYAIDHGKHILPVLLENCEVPLRLRRLQHVDFTRKSFDEGIDSAKRLLSKLNHELEREVANAPAISEESPRGNKYTHQPSELKTIPRRKYIPPPQEQPEISHQGKHLYRNGMAGIGILLAGIAITITMVLVLNPEAVPSPSPPVEATASPSPAPTATITAAPTDIPTQPTVGIPRSFNEDFLTKEQWGLNWILKFRHANEREINGFKYEIIDGNLVSDISYKNVWGYFLYNPAITYENVEIEAVVENLRSTATLGLVCQFGDTGWYQFDINGGGLYYVRYVDRMDSGIDEERFLIMYGSIPGFKDSYSAVRENTIRAGCDRNRLTLIVNDVVLINNKQAKFDRVTGQVGVAIRTYENYPALVVLKSVSIREP